VVFTPLDVQGQVAIPEGKIESDGSYSLRTLGKRGAPPGKYRVSIDPGGDKDIRPLFDPTYSSSAKSPLEIEVGENKPAGAYDLIVPAREQP
jgi:hypothetical protein